MVQIMLCYNLIRNLVGGGEGKHTVKITEDATVNLKFKSQLLCPIGSANINDLTQQCGYRAHSISDATYQIAFHKMSKITTFNQMNMKCIVHRFRNIF